MIESIYIANTYLNVLTRSNRSLLKQLKEALGPDSLDLLKADFLHGPDIDRVFSKLLEHGLDSWLLRYGKDLNIASHGPLGFAVLSAPNLQTALNVLSDHIVIRSSAYQLKIELQAQHAKCVLIDNTGGGLTGRWLIETGFRLTQQLIEGVMAHPLGSNAKVNFAYPEPVYKDELNALFGVDCQFNAAQNSLQFPASWCQITSPLSDNETFNTNLTKCRELKLALRAAPQFTEIITLALHKYFDAREHGKVTINQLPTLLSLAKKHHLSSRTLNRRLKAQDTSYKLLLAQARKDKACHLLKNTHLSVADISYNLAYQEPANFVRAFKTWFGITPGSWRRKMSAMIDGQ